jgi:hypothetical protein
MQNTIAERIYDAAKRRDKYEAIINNIERNSGHIPKSFAEKLQSAEFDLAVAKDDRSDPYVRD